MSELATSLLISGGIFVVMMLTQYGRRNYEVRRLAIPLVSVAAFGFSYLKDMPAGNNIWLYAIALAVGIGFGVLTTITTKVARNAQTGKIQTITALPFAIAWFVAVALRVGFVIAVNSSNSFMYQVGKFFYLHNLSTDAIAPFFVIMALSTVLYRVGAVYLKVRSVQQAPAVDRELTSTYQTV